MTPLPLHPGSAEDLSEVMAVMDAAFPSEFGEAWNRAQCLGILTLSDVWLTLAGVPGAAQGFALCRRVTEDAELLLLAVTPRARRRGTARLLIEHSAGEAARRGATRLMLEVRASNPALALYGDAGFAEIGRRPAYYRGPHGELHDAITLARDLPLQRETA